jgi:hypothetical protein
LARGGLTTFASTLVAEPQTPATTIAAPAISARRPRPRVDRVN